MSINVLQLLESVLSDDVVKTLSTRYGLTPDLTRKVTGSVAPALLAAFMQRSSTAEGARRLFSDIMSPATNAVIGAQLPGMLSNTSSLATLETGGRDLIQRATGANVGVLAEAVAAHTGVAQSTAISLCGIVGGALMGTLKQHFMHTQGVAGQLPTLLGHQLQGVNAGMTDGIAGTLGLGSAAAFGGAVSSKLADVSAQLGHPQTQTQTQTQAQTQTQSPPVPDWVPPQTGGATSARPRKSARAWLGWLIALVALALAFLVLRSCHRGEAGAPATQADVASGTASASAPVSAAEPASDASAAAAGETASAPAAAPAPTQDSHLSFTVDKSGMPTITATLGSDAEKAQLLDALTKQFGDGKFAANITVDPATKPADWLAHLDGLLPLMALPGAQVKIDGQHVELSGAAADAKAGWSDKLKALLGTGFDVGVFNVQQAVADATQSFRDAMKGLFGSDASCEGADVAKALNLQVVNFATGGARVPASATDDLRQTAKALAACAKHGKPVELEVAGYSDNVGDAQSNRLLSKKRAQAVRRFLVEQGVPSQSLTAEGYGDAKPVDSNDTDSGRFHNRRIEFAPKQ